MAFLEARGVRMTFPGPESRHVLDDVNLDAERGQFTAITGPSGSGKSTLLYILGSLERPTAGTVTIDGQDVTSLPGRRLPRLRRHVVGFVFQFFNLITGLSALENVELPAVFAGMPARERRRRALGLLADLGVDAVARQPVRLLSGGEKQRVAIARAVMNSPRVLFADEPTGALDRASGATVIDILTGLCRSRQLALLVVTHDLSVASRADRVLTLIDGRLEGGDR